MLSPEIVVAALSGAAGALSVSRVNTKPFQTKLDQRFSVIESELNNLKNTVLHDYVLKEDFLREMQAVHNKLDRILDYLIKTSNH